MVKDSAESHCMQKAALRNEFKKHLEYLEALAFFVQDLNPTLRRSLEHSRENLESFSYQRLLGLLRVVKREIGILRDGYGAIADNEFYRELLAEARADASKGYAYIEKLKINRLMYSKYENVFGRWPHVKYHAFVIFDPQTDKSLRQIYQLDSVLWDDVKLMLGHSKDLYGTEPDFRKRT